MPRTNLWNHNLPRAEIDQRSREARLRFELIIRLFILRATSTHTRLRRLLYLLTVGRYGRPPQDRRSAGPLDYRGRGALAANARNQNEGTEATRIFPGVG